MAARQVMAALQADVGHEGITHDTLVRALDAVRPVEQPQDSATAPERRPARHAA